MKKTFYFLVVLVLSASLVACGVKKPSNADTAPTNTAPTITAPDNTAPDNNQITPTTEVTYLPPYDGVKLTKYTPATTEDPFAEAEYLIPLVKDVKVYQDYKAILIKDGWTITEEMPVTKFTANKDTHTAYITIMIFNNEVLLNVRSN